MEYKKHKGDERRIRYTLEQLKEITSKSTQVVNWYPHSDGTIRGPYCRWLIVTGGDGDREYTSPIRNDVEYASMAMNALPFLIEDKEKLEEIVEKLERENKELKWDGALNEAEEKINKLEQIIKLQKTYINQHSIPKETIKRQLELNDEIKKLQEEL